MSLTPASACACSPSVNQRAGQDGALPCFSSLCWGSLPFLLLALEMPSTWTEATLRGSCFPLLSELMLRFGRGFSCPPLMFSPPIHPFFCVYIL